MINQHFPKGRHNPKGERIIKTIIIVHDFFLETGVGFNNVVPDLGLTMLVNRKTISKLWSEIIYKKLVDNYGKYTEVL